jgi:hypothetical protein
MFQLPQGLQELQVRHMEGVLGRQIRQAGAMTLTKFSCPWAAVTCSSLDILGSENLTKSYREESL